MTHLTDLLLRADRGRPRSQQRELGFSALGSCRKQAAFILAGTEPTDPGGSVQAALGTAIHEAAAAALWREQHAGTRNPADLIEHPVTFGGIIGTLDHYEADTTTVHDTKTTSSRFLAVLKGRGAELSHRWQVTAYAVALVAQGVDVTHVQLDYLARDTGEEWTWREPLDVNLAADALDWLQAVEDMGLEDAPRDRDPEGPFCSSCQFATACWDGGVRDRDVRSVLYPPKPQNPSNFN